MGRDFGVLVLMKRGLTFTVHRIVEVPDSDHSEEDLFKLVEGHKKALEDQGWTTEDVEDLDEDPDEDDFDEDDFDDEDP